MKNGQSGFEEGGCGEADLAADVIEDRDHAQHVGGGKYGVEHLALSAVLCRAGGQHAGA